MGVIQIETTALVKHILEQNFIIFFCDGLPATFTLALWLTQVSAQKKPSSKMMVHVEACTLKMCIIIIIIIIFTVAAQREKPVNVYHGMKAVLVTYLESAS